jgi:hypothetical protein
MPLVDGAELGHGAPRSVTITLVGSDPVQPAAESGAELADPTSIGPLHVANPVWGFPGWDAETLVRCW